MQLKEKRVAIQTRFDELTVKKNTNLAENEQIDQELFRLQWENRLIDEMEKEAEPKGKAEEKPKKA